MAAPDHKRRATGSDYGSFGCLGRPEQRLHDRALDGKPPRFAQADSRPPIRAGPFGHCPPGSHSPGARRGLGAPIRRQPSNFAIPPKTRCAARPVA
ncbi:hypothetical protein [Azotobacter salinestris]|uniref:hypothetical protein n=1 Tax=Azotobacter salinestris TaxID=69964 RepID=UPI001266A345|nr:hypothetical protein [Azotobacter salinestris]